MQRRRTQIRIAQRAYRLRKESTIAAFKKRVEDLEDIIDQMNKSFIDLQDRVIDSGMVSSNSSLGEQLRFATKRFLELSTAALPTYGEEDDLLTDPGNDNSPTNPHVPEEHVSMHYDASDQSGTSWDTFSMQSLVAKPLGIEHLPQQTQGEAIEPYFLQTTEADVQQSRNPGSGLHFHRSQVPNL